MALRRFIILLYAYAIHVWTLATLQCHLAEIAKSRLRGKIPELEEALSGFFRDHHAKMCKTIIKHIDFLDETISELTSEITKLLAPFDAAVVLVSSIPGISEITAQVIVAETGADMSKFPTPGHLCAWAGVAPANYESGGKRKPYGTRHGSPYLRRILVESARAAARTKNSYYFAQYSSIAKRRGANKAAVAVAHSMLETIWHMLNTGSYFVDPGSDFFKNQVDLDVQAKRLASKIKALGFEVTITKSQVA